MGAEWYYYFVKYKPYAGVLFHELDQQGFHVETALSELRRREFEAGRYYPATDPEFPLGPGSASPGAQHADVHDAIAESRDVGTRSILDLDHIAEDPEFGAAARLRDEVLVGLYGTARPTRTMVEADMSFYEGVERGQGVYLLVYKGGEPDEVFFGGLLLRLAWRSSRRLGDRRHTVRSSGSREPRSAPGIIEVTEIGGRVRSALALDVHATNRGNR